MKTTEHRTNVSVGVVLQPTRVLLHLRSEDQETRIAMTAQEARWLTSKLEDATLVVEQLEAQADGRPVGPTEGGRS